MEIPCPTCPTWSQFIQDKSKISIYLSLDKYKFMFKVNTILHFIFCLIITSSYVAMKTVWILISWLLQKPADLDLHRLKESSHMVSYFKRIKGTERYIYKLICSFGQVKIFFGHVHYGHLLVPGQVGNFTISTPLR